MTTGEAGHDDAHRAVFGSSSLAAAQFEPVSGRLTWVNEALEKLLGRSTEALIGQDFRQFTHPDDRAANEAGVQAVCSGEQAEFTMQQRLLHSDGHDVWVTTNLTRRRDARGEPLDAAAILLDISDLRHVDRARDTSEQRLQLALHATHLGTWEWDLATDRQELSAAACDIMGFASGATDFDADACRALVHADDVEALWHLDDAARGGRRFHAEYRIVTPAGRVAWVANHAWTLLGADEQPIRVIGTLADVTARKQVEHELRLVRDELEARVLERTDALAAANTALVNEVAERRAAEEHANELMSQLVNAEEDERRRLSRDMHDTLGQHLTALAIGLKTLGQDPEVPPALQKRIVDLQHAVGDLDDEIDRLAHELRPSALDDLGLADALFRHAQNWSVQSGVAVEVVTDGMDGRRFSPAIEAAVYRVVQEALTNVRKHASATRVGVIVEHRAGEMRAIVEDDGGGFEPTPSGWSPLDGRGLGLRGMAERARLCGGRLEIESLPGTGTTIYLTIPLRDSSPDVG